MCLTSDLFSLHKCPVRTGSAMELDARLLVEFDAVYSWTSRDRVIIEQMVRYLARLNVFPEVEELETYLSVRQMLRGILAWSVCV